MKRRMNLQFFAAPDTGNNGGSTPAQQVANSTTAQPASTTAQQAAEQQSAVEQQPANTQGQSAEQQARVFTQDELNSILGRENNKTINGIKKTLGLPKDADLNTALQQIASVISQTQQQTNAGGPPASPVQQTQIPQLTQEQRYAEELQEMRTEMLNTKIENELVLANIKEDFISDARIIINAQLKPGEFKQDEVKTLVKNLKTRYPDWENKQQTTINGTGNNVSGAAAAAPASKKQGELGKNLGESRLKSLGVWTKKKEQ